MVVAKIRGRKEWWSAPSQTQIHSLAASASVSTGILIEYEVIDAFPDETLTRSTKIDGVSIYKPAAPDALSNAEHQRNFRNRRNQTHRLLRVWVPIHKYEQLKQYCKEQL